LNGQAVATLPTNSYTDLRVQPGPHRIGAGRSVADGLAWTVHEQMVVADPRTTYYFVISGPSRQPRVDPLASEEASAVLSRAAYRPTSDATDVREWPISDLDP